MNKITKRWMDGVPHHPVSAAIVQAMADLDFEHNRDSLCIKTGGDGDNGETMMYLIDEYLSSCTPSEREQLAKLLVSTDN